MRAFRIALIITAVAFTSLAPLAAHAWYQDWTVYAGKAKTGIYHNWWGLSVREAYPYPAQRDVSVGIRDKVWLKFQLQYDDSSWIYGGAQMTRINVYVGGFLHETVILSRSTGTQETRSGVLTGYSRRPILIGRPGWHRVDILMSASVGTTPDMGYTERRAWSTIWIYASQ